MRGVVQTRPQHLYGTDRPYHNDNTYCGEWRQRQCQADRIHRAGIPAVQPLFLTAASTVTSTVPSTRRTHAPQAAEATARHGTEPASVTLKRIRYALSACRQDAMSRRPMSITSHLTEETAFSSGIRATGRASATDTTASRPEMRITPPSTSTKRKPHSLSLQFRQTQGCTYGRDLGAGATAGGGSESLRESEQKTVGPSRVKKREIAGPPVNLDPDRN